MIDLEATTQATTAHLAQLGDSYTLNENPDITTVIGNIP